MATTSGSRLRACVVSTVHMWAQVGHCSETRVPAVLRRYCQWIWQLWLFWHCGQPWLWLQLGQGSQARLLWAAGSIGKWFTGSPHWADGCGEGCAGVVGGVAWPRLRPLHAEIALPDSAVGHVSCDPSAQQW